MGGSKDRPWFKFYPKDFASDPAVEAMSTEAVGAYILLLCKAWQSDPVGTLPKDDRVLARYARLTVDEWSVIRDDVLAPWTDDGERFRQKRLSREWEELEQQSERFRLRAKKAAAARHQKGLACSKLQASVKQPTSTVRASESESESESKSGKLSKDESGGNAPRGPVPYSQAFLEWWEHYPRKTAKREAFNAWRSRGVGEREAMLAGVKAYAEQLAQYGLEKGAPNPATWLNGGRYEDDPPEWVAMAAKTLRRPDPTSTLAGLSERSVRSATAGVGWASRKAAEQERRIRNGTG